MKLYELLDAPIQGRVKICGFPRQGNKKPFIELDGLSISTRRIIRPVLLNAEIDFLETEAKGGEAIVIINLKGWEPWTGKEKELSTIHHLKD